MKYRFDSIACSYFHQISWMTSFKWIEPKENFYEIWKYDLFQSNFESVTIFAREIIPSVKENLRRSSEYFRLTVLLNNLSKSVKEYSFYPMSNRVCQLYWISFTEPRRRDTSKWKGFVFFSSQIRNYLVSPRFARTNTNVVVPRETETSIRFHRNSSSAKNETRSQRRGGIRRSFFFNLILALLV